MPPLLAEAAAAHPAGAAAAPPASPSVDAVLEKYATAIGGKESLAKIRNREITGTFTGGDGEPHPIQIMQTDSGQYRSSVKVNEGSFTIVFNGKSGTSGGPSWNNPMQPDEVERIRTRARLFPAVGLRERFPALAVRGSEKVDGRDAWLVTARADDGARMSFWFDAENGLLLRTLQRQHTTLGDIPEQADYSDYRGRRREGSVHDPPYRARPWRHGGGHGDQAERRRRGVPLYGARIEAVTAPREVPGRQSESGGATRARPHFDPVAAFVELPAIRSERSRTQT
jgi:hypothetical protein